MVIVEKLLTNSITAMNHHKIKVTSHAAKKLGEKDLIAWFPFLEILFIIFQFTIFIIYSLSKSNSWK